MIHINKKTILNLFLSSFFIVLITSCTKEEKAADPYASKIENAHNKSVYSSKKASRFDIFISFGGNERLNGELTLTNDSQKGKIKLVNGDEILFINNKVYASPTVEASKVRFDAYTWSYFFQFPYKLADEGTIWTEYKSETEGYNTKKLSFAAGTGDAPDDWYVIYTDPKTGLIHHTAYIVTAHGGKEKAEKDPHAIEFTNYSIVDGVPFAQNWTFKNWNASTGLGNEIGKATLTNITLLDDLEDTFFDVSKDFVEIKN